MGKFEYQFAVLVETERLLEFGKMLGHLEELLFNLAEQVRLEERTKQESVPISQRRLRRNAPFQKGNDVLCGPIAVIFKKKVRVSKQGNPDVGCRCRTESRGFRTGILQCRQHPFSKGSRNDGAGFFLRWEKGGDEHLGND